MLDKTKINGVLLFDWGNTLMLDFPDGKGPMCSWPEVAPVENAAQVLSVLHKGWFIALATNAKDSSQQEIKKAFLRLDLLKYIDQIYCYENVGHAKPSPEFFSFISHDLNISPSQMIMIGDDFANDIQGANAFGIHGIWLNRKTKENINTLLCKTIQSLSGLPECLNKLNKEKKNEPEHI